jgi:hypothetical protein
METTSDAMCQIVVEFGHILARRRDLSRRLDS